MEKQSHHRALLALLVVVAAALVVVPRAEAAPCGTPGNNEIIEENCKPGTPQSQWDVSGAGDASIQGFATDISVAQGGTVQFKVDTTAPGYRLDIYRMGYYGGNGARFITTVNPTVVRDEDTCPEQAATGLIDCSGWAVSAAWNVPVSAVSGIYFAKLVSSTGGSSHVPFIVRDDDGASNVLFQTSDTTWQAYNTYGGNSLYQGNPDGRAYKVSYNRPFITRGNAPEDWLFNAEYPMVRWLERNGYDVSYSTGVDTDRRGAELLEHKVFLSVGHDEYWSGAQRANVEAARDAGVNLAFLSGNEVFWKTRLENGDRTLVTYKETHAGAEIGSDPVWTGTWRDPRPFNAEGPRPENALTGTSFSVNSGSRALSVPAEDGRLRLWRNSPVGSQLLGAVATLTDGTIGYEWDEDLDNGSRPAGLVRLSSTSASGVEKLQDYGSTYASGSATHHLTLYRDTNGAGPDALVFGAGSVQWSWGLDSEHDRGSDAADRSMQQATVNLFADMGVQPGMLQADLSAASASTDTAPPTPTIVSPPGGTTVEQRQPVVVTGTAADAGGRVGAVEVSVDGGASWHPASGRESWSYTWTPTTAGQVTLRSRAADDSGNLSAASAGVTVTVTGRTCPCSMFGTQTPVQSELNDNQPIEVGVRFRSDQAGRITALRYYKGTTWPAGTRTGHLWSAAGELLGTAQFTGETASGWQQAPLATPVTLTPGTTYVASYLSSGGSYAADLDFFTTTYDAAPLHAPTGGNGVYTYGGGFPSETARDTNYWADVVFAPADTTGPAVTAVAPADGATGVAAGTTVSATFDEPLAAATVNGNSVQLRAASGTLVPAAVAYAAATRTATLTPAAALTAGATYTATVSDVEDTAGNVLGQARTWSFRIAPAIPDPDPEPDPGGEPDDQPPAATPTPTPVPGALPATGGGGAPATGSGPGAGSPPAAADRIAPRVQVRPRSARVSRTGAVTLRVACPAGEVRCRVALRLKLGRRDAAARTFTLTGGRTQRVRLQLSRRARRALAGRGSLSVIAIAATRDAAGNRATTRTAIRIVSRHAKGAA